MIRYTGPDQYGYTRPGDILTFERWSVTPGYKIFHNTRTGSLVQVHPSDITETFPA